MKRKDNTLNLKQSDKERIIEELGLTSLEDFRIVHRYDVQGVSEEVLNQAIIDSVDAIHPHYVYLYNKKHYTKAESTAVFQGKLSSIGSHHFF